MSSITATNPHKFELAPLLLRFGLGAIFIFHGYLKVIPDGGFTWANEFGLHPNVQALVAWAELVGGIAVTIGFLARPAALGLAFIMVGAMYFVTGRDFIPVELGPGAKGFNFQEIGYEYNFAILVICITLMVLGSGPLSLDHVLFRRRLSTENTPPAPRQM